MMVLVEVFPARDVGFWRPPCLIVFVVPLFRAWYLINSTLCLSDAAREVCHDSRWFRQARKLLLTACVRMAKSARRCSPRHSRRFAKRAMEQCAQNSRGTLPFASTRCGRLYCFQKKRFSLVASAHVCLRGSLLNVSLLLGLTLRPSAPVCCCHRDSLTRWRLALAQEAARDASSPSSHLFL